MDEIGRLQAMVGTFSTKVAGRPFPEVGVDVREEPIPRLEIAIRLGVQQRRDCTRR